MTEVRIGQGESLDEALRRFRKKCQRNGIISEMKRHERYEKPSERRRKREQARRKKKR
ncbi:MAG: 30S ribosomal protein S21 [Candidatus Caldatribacterium sp.]|uniref:30S ribosomal protein S21 n=1 Tax=Candidatus Caldatribacterium sp. TaxID=2282143 RepID=UPI00299963CE|nr:30S ribosomal protein S21 [Candidatus Caldatribacterium sp.]MCX7729909.1 30S ribosomal protein S21 [Candidatus Caldatribacterium sp.]MDW8081249.1 30S ribosomal protein S21 [Candidatus Calescibacterium sp.]